MTEENPKDKKNPKGKKNTEDKENTEEYHQPNLASLEEEGEGEVFHCDSPCGGRSPCPQRNA